MGDVVEDYVKRVRDLLLHGRPDAARFYALVRLNAGSSAGRRFPASGSFELVPEGSFEAPYGVPPGEYLVTYFAQRFDQSMVPYRKTHPSHKIEISWPDRAAGTPAAATPPQADPLTGMAQGPQINFQDPDLREAQIDFEKHKMAVAMQRDTHRLVRSAAHARDAGESFSLVSAYRQDAYQNAEAFAALCRRMAENMTRVHDQQVAMVQSIEPTIAAVKRASELLATPPTPPAPVDYTPVLCELVTVGGSMLKSLLEHDSRRKRSADEPREIGEARAVKHEPNVARQASPVSNPPPAAAKTTPSARAATSRAAAHPPQLTASAESSASRGSNQAPAASHSAPAASAEPAIDAQEQMVNELAEQGADAAQDTIDMLVDGVVKAAPEKDLPLAEPPRPVHPVEVLTDPQRPELAKATQAFLSQFRSGDELRVVIAAMAPWLLLGQDDDPGKKSK